MHPSPWFTLTLSAGLVIMAMLYTLPDKIPPPAAQLSAPFTAVTADTWCAEDGACWQRVPHGVTLTVAEGTSYAAIGLQEGDTLTHFSNTTVTGLSSVHRLSEHLQQRGSVCLGIQRDQQRLHLRLSVAGAADPHQPPCLGIKTPDTASSGGREKPK